MKKCKQCKRTIKIQDFKKDGIEYKRCNKCREYAKEYYKQYRAKYPEKYKEMWQRYKENNLERIRRRDRIAHQKYRDENPEEYKEKRIAYCIKNKDKLKLRDKNRILNRPEYFLFSSARFRARKRKLKFNITEREIKILLNMTLICPLRKTKFEKGSNKKANDNSPSLDRIDSSKGYTKNNIQIISYRANVVKNNIDLKLFRKIVENLEHLKPEIHATDDDTRSIIIQDRLLQIANRNCSKKEISRLMTLEAWLFRSATKRAKKNNLEINIDKDYIKSIWPLDNKCPILKEKFVFGQGIISDMSATIDRIDNNKGYIKGNVVIISFRVNVVKNKLTLEELKFMLKNWEDLENKRKVFSE